MNTTSQNNVSIPVRKEKEIEIMRMELELMNKVVSPEDLKTELSRMEIVTLSLLEEMNDNPFKISEKIASTRNIPFDMSRYQYGILGNFVSEYMRKGKALKRKGIAEDVKMISAYCEQHSNKDEKQKTPTVLK